MNKAKIESVTKDQKICLPRITSLPQKARAKELTVTQKWLQPPSINPSPELIQRRKGSR